MKRLESNLLNMLLSLTIVTLVAAALLGGLYVLTEEPINQQKLQKQQSAITAVLPQVEELQIAEPEQVGENIIIYKACDAAQNYVGAAVQTEENGFGGKFKLMIGFDKDGNIVNYEVLEHQETPGLGDHMVDWFKTDKNRQSVIGKNTATTNFTVSKDGGDVDAITAATISSRAFLKAVVQAYEALAPQSVEGESGATVLAEDASLTADSVQVQEQDTVPIIEEEPVVVKEETPAPVVKKKAKKKSVKKAVEQAEPASSAEESASAPAETTLVTPEPASAAETTLTTNKETTESHE